jgi:hypothetical protein
MSDDHSPGDARKPYSDRGGPEGRHAETHDVRREELTNPTGPDKDVETFDEITPSTPDEIRQAGAEGGVAADADSSVVKQLGDLTNDELASLTILDPDTPLEQGSVYLDLGDPSREPFTATGGETAGDHGRVIAKKTTDYELWNKVTRKRTD